MEEKIRWARVEDAKKLVSFLKAAGLRTDGVEESIECFLILEKELGMIHGTIGIEPHGKIGLLRSLVMTENTNEDQLLMFFKKMQQVVREKDLHILYLATDKPSSMQFFSLLGFVKVEKEDLPPEILSSDHVLYILSVDNSAFMKLLVQ